MKKPLVIIMLIFLTLTWITPVSGIYMPPSRVKPTQEDINVATNFFKNLKWDLSQASKGVLKLTLPKMDSKYTVGIGQAAINEQKIPLDGKRLYQGSGGTVLTTNISTTYPTWFNFQLGNDDTSAVIAIELYTYSPGDTSVNYIPGPERVFPVIGPDGNITGWVNAIGGEVNEDGSPISTPSQPPAPKSYFSDINSKYWAFNVINILYEAKYIKGYPDGTFKPNNNITRAEFMVMLGNVLKDKWSNYSPYNHTGENEMIPSTHWSYSLVKETFKYMPKADINRIFGDNFKPDLYITREEVVAVLASILNVHPNYQTKPSVELIFLDISQSSFPESIRFVSSHNLVLGYPDNTFKPLNKITRAEISAIMVKVIGYM